MSKHDFQIYFYDRATDVENVFKYAEMYDVALEDAIFDAECTASPEEYFDIYIIGEESYSYSSHYES